MYQQGSRPGFPPIGPTVRALMIALFGIQIVYMILINNGAADEMLGNLPLWAPEGFESGKIWQVFTYMWIHDHHDVVSHLLLNLLILYFIGPMFESAWGKKDFLRFFMLCGLGGGVLTLILSWFAPGMFGGMVVGSSGAMLGLIVAFGLTYPNREMYIFFVIPVRGSTLIPLTIGIDLLMWLSTPSGGGRIAIAAHWGGMLTAYLLITGRWRPDRFRSRLTEIKKKKARSKLGVVNGGKKDGQWIN
jgi:membrane associated rhomboid family serine protease